MKISVFESLRNIFIPKRFPRFLHCSLTVVHWRVLVGFWKSHRGSPPAFPSRAVQAMVRRRSAVPASRAGSVRWRRLSPFDGRLVVVRRRSIRRWAPGRWKQVTLCLFMYFYVFSTSFYVLLCILVIEPDRAYIIFKYFFTFYTFYHKIAYKTKEK